ncbi:hypothetical protein KY285_023832 [Solanum tuberosum]|nr:hypothetical protein KY289_024157 [Solanum tuberosum]KAH0676031.1 hypothetical protein KY285_023832 [Solanum tuberosum]
MESMHQEMQVDMERKLQEEREHMAANLKRSMEEDLQKKLEEEREHMKGEVDKMFQEQMTAIMTRMQQTHFCDSLSAAGICVSLALVKAIVRDIGTSLLA